MLPRSATVALFLLLGSRLFSQTSPCVTPEVMHHRELARKISNQLLNIRVPDNGQTIPLTPETKTGIHELKDALAAATDAYMTCQTGDTIFISGLESDLAFKEEHHPSANALDPKGNDLVYGGGLTLAARMAEKFPNLLLVQWTFTIQCGYDNVLLVYARRDGKWIRALRWQSPDYDEINGAFGDFFEYQVVPHGGANGWAVAVAHGHPWCTSRSSAFDLDVISAAEGATAPQVIFHKNAGYARDVDPRMKARDDGFDLRLSVWMLDMGVMNRQGIYRYKTVGDAIERMQPIAVNGRDFVDEWLQLDWNEAAKWSAPAQLATLKAAHGKIASTRKSKETVLVTYGAVRRCTDARNHYQVEVEEDPGGSVYFQIAEGGNSYNMLSASERPDARCNGANIMPKQ